MSFDLRAILRLDDRFSDPLRRIERQAQRNQRAMDQLGKTTGNANRNHVSLGSSVGKLSSGLGGLKSSIIGVVGAYLSLQSAKSIFDATVGNAAKFEQSNVIIGAMFDDKALAKQYTEMLDKFAADSPVMDSQAMFSNSKGFITATKDIKQLEKMWSLTERMAAIDPVQGVEGSVMALKELFSGDAVSMVERFEMPKKIMNEIKKLPLDQQLTKLDEYFNKIGMTTKLIDEMGGTTIGLWAQVREKFALVLRDMGAPSLEVVGGFLTKVLDKLNNGELDRFGQVGARWIENILTGLTNGVIRIYDWFTSIANSEEWKKATTLSSKIELIIDNLSDKFTKWYEGGGKKDLESMAKTLTHGLSALLIDNADTIGKAALKVGSAIGTAMKEGMMASFKENNPFLYYLTQFINDPLVSTIGGLDKPRSQGGKYVAPDWYKSLEEKGKSHNGGLDYVRYDGYQASLHRGEKVLTRTEATAYRNGKSSGNTYNFGGIHIQGSGSYEKDADKILEILANKIQLAGGAGA